jgi:hypothetical protein
MLSVVVGREGLVGMSYVVAGSLVVQIFPVERFLWVAFVDLRCRCCGVAVVFELNATVGTGSVNVWASYLYLCFDE